VRVDDVRRFLGSPSEPPAPRELSLAGSRRGAGYTIHEAAFPASDGDRVPSFLLVPDDVRDAPGVVVHHQHAAQWHLGNSEPCGLAGDRLQAFGAALAAAGSVVLCPDSIGFQDRRRRCSGTQPHPDDADQQERELSHRLVRGDTLARKVLSDAEDALTALQSVSEVDPERVGLMGHSYGGNIVIFEAALDARVRFACTSGAAGTHRGKLAHDIGVDRAEVIPGVLSRFDIDDLLAMIAPRPLLVAAGDDDRFARDVREVVEAARAAYGALGATDALSTAVTPGGHAMTEERFETITSWFSARRAR
jgi:dienelactone hydrolase